MGGGGTGEGRLWRGGGYGRGDCGGVWGGGFVGGFVRGYGRGVWVF